jgi:hypothetical protein
MEQNEGFVSTCELTDVYVQLLSMFCIDKANKLFNSHVRETN